MKKIIAFSLLCLFAASSYAQKDHSDNHDEHKSDKSKDSDYEKGRNKEIINRFYKEVLGGRKPENIKGYFDPKFINHSSGQGVVTGSDDIISFFNGIVTQSLSDVKFQLLQQVEEKELVTTRLVITGTHKGELMGQPASGKVVSIEFIDIYKISKGKMVEHWGLTNLSDVIKALNASK